MTDSALVSALFLGFSERIDSTFWDHLLELNKALRNRIKASEGNSRANISTTGCVNNHTKKSKYNNKYLFIRIFFNLGKHVQAYLLILFTTERLLSPI